jgi:6-phosphogluconate dehydrogenase
MTNKQPKQGYEIGMGVMGRNLMLNMAVRSLNFATLDLAGDKLRICANSAEQCRGQGGLEQVRTLFRAL